ncbi:hypothetical protein SAMN05421548_11013 [Paraburkholderia lycopersici]|uniref:Uncharacterized protein n=2 Tax=Paraburkholderia lycopersici TaxID=416944 RepID=A0A1G6P536_9BURK|nr:hypothetical protein SAMN05421548_11013 [Paraburkholderia lycopersici]
MEQTPPALPEKPEPKAPPTPKPPPDRTANTINGVINAFEAIGRFKKWLDTPDPPKPPKAPPAKKDYMAVPPFDIQEIPGAMRKEHMPVAAKLMERWFSGRENGPDETSIVKLDWVLKFAHAKERYEYLVNTAIRSPEVQNNLVEMLFPYRQQIEVFPAKLADSPRELHRRFQFQHAGVGGTLNDNLIRQLRAGKETFATPSDLVAALGTFNFYAAVGHARFSRDRSSLSGAVTAEVTGVWVYVRDDYGFSEQSQYLGHWSKDGLITLPHDEAVTIGNPHVKGNVRYPVYDKDFRQWSARHKHGGDFVIFSDRLYVPVSPPIRLYLKGDAQAFEYKPLDAPNGDVEQVAGSTGRPGNNQAQNKQTNDVARILRLTPDQAQQLHYELGSEPPMGFHEIMERAKDMFDLW